jgi:malate dehydrogenase
MVEAIIRDEKRVIPSSAYLTGQYGLRDVYIGVPVKIGAAGVEDILEVELTDDENKALHASAGVVAKNIAELKQWGIFPN